MVEVTFEYDDYTLLVVEVTFQNVVIELYNQVLFNKQP
jgi:hypothetical protein